MWEQINTYVAAKEWTKVNKLLSSLLENKKEGLKAALLYSKVLRVQAKGQEANEVLLACITRPLHAKAEQWGQLAEELLQAAYWQEALHIIHKVELALPEMGKFLQLILLREQEDWTAFTTLAEQLNQAPAPWPTLVQIQMAWAMLRQGNVSIAESLLSKHIQNGNFAVHKLHVRLLIAKNKQNDAHKKLVILYKKQPQDWETLGLFALFQPQQARLLFNQSLASQPRQADTLTNQANFFVQQGDLNAAKLNCEQALHLKPWYKPPLLLWLNVLQANQQLSDALVWLDKQINDFPTPTKYAAQLDLLRLNNTDVLILQKAAEKALKIYPNDADILLSAGAVFQVIQQIDQAIRVYNRRLELLPEDHATRNNLAQLWRDQGDIEMAVSLWKEIGRQADITIQLNLAQALQQRGDIIEAESIYRSVLKQQKDHPIALRGFAKILMNSGDYAQAWLLAEKAIKISPDQARSWLIAAKIKAKQGSKQDQFNLLAQGIKNVTNPLQLHQSLFRLWLQANQHEQAHQSILNWIKKDPKEVEYPLMLADIYYKKNAFIKAEAAIKQAVACNNEKGYVALIRFYEQRERLGSARKIAKQRVRSDPNTMRNYGLLSEVLQRQERYEEALKAIEMGLAIEPTRLSLVRQKVGQLLALERYDDAIKTAQQLVNFKQSPPHINLLLIAYKKSRNYHAAIKFCRKILEKIPKDRVINLSLAENLLNNHQLKEAIDILYQLKQLEPYNLQVANRLIRYLVKSNRYTEAQATLQSIIEIAGERPDTLVMLVQILKDMGEHKKAYDLLKLGIKKFPKYVVLHKNLIQILQILQQPNKEQAAIEALLESFPVEEVLIGTIKPLIRLQQVDKLIPYLETWQKKSPQDTRVLWAQFKIAKLMHVDSHALVVLDAIEAHQTDNPEVLTARADIDSNSWRLSTAIKTQRRVCKLRPDQADHVAKLLNLQVKAGDFDEFEQHIQRLQHLWGGERYQYYRNFFFNFNCHPTWTAKEVYRFYNDWYQKSVFPYRPIQQAHLNTIEPNRRLRIAYISPDFRRHAVAYFSEPLLIKHDREQFELFAFAHIDFNQSDEYTARFKRYFHHWVDISHMNEHELDKRIRDEKIDILIDLAGHTANNALAVFLKKPAPIQMSWLFGAGQTTGLKEVDYLCSDKLCIPPEHTPYISEKLLCLPKAGFPFSPAHDYLPSKSLPCLEKGYITFGVLARPLRTNRGTIKVWAEILHKLPTAKLRFDHIPYAEKDIQQRITTQFSELGIKKKQLIFLNTRPHWKVYQEIDIQLDPFPAGSGTTITEGLWMERIAVTLRSRPPMGRIPSAMLTALNLEQYGSAKTKQEYIQKAVYLANHPQLVKELSYNLRERMQNSWLMNYKQYGIETAKLYRKVWQDYCQQKDTENLSQKSEG